MEFVFSDIMGCSAYDYVVNGLPSQVQVSDERRERAVDAAVKRFVKLVDDSLPAGYTFDGWSISSGNELDCCPIGYPSRDGVVDVAAIIDNLEFKPVLSAYRKVR